MTAAEPDFRALVFSKTAGFRHASIPTGVAAIEQLGEENNFAVDVTEDAAAFTEDNLAQYDAVIWLSTTGDVLNADQQDAFESYIQNGGGYAGIHAASDTEYDWPWYGDLVGAYFKGHPTPQNATVKVEDHAHPSTEHLAEQWDRFDEWYDFRENPRNDVHVLMSLDETSYTGGTMGRDHPLAWCQAYDGGRAWYTGGGHTDESFAEPDFREHVLGGIRSAAGVDGGDCNASQSDGYELVTLAENTGNPMSLTVASDGTVFYIERDGRVQRIDKESQRTTTALSLPVTLGNEDGLLGFVLDPDFENNNWAYAYWSPSSVSAQDGPHNRLSRYTYDRDAQSFDPASERTVLKITTQRNTCCHAGGDMVFDLDGNLVLATGDNTNPFESDGYAPLDERAGRQDFDAQRTAGNTNDLRGKLVRITPQDDGTYTVPAGNLFAPGTDKTRPEIYAMGFRNPFRIGLDPYTGNILVGDYGPDAGSASATRGPAATTEWNIVDEPGNYGWPYCAGVKCYIDYDFGSKVSGSRFNPNALVNNSPNNTGLTNLPPVILPEQWGEQGASDNPFKEIGNGSGYTGAPMGGPVYSFDPDLDVETKWPAYWDNKALFGDWNTGQMFTFQLNRDEENAPRNTQIVKVNPLFPDFFNASAGFHRAMDMEFGPDGSLYAIDWGSGFGGDNDSSGIYRIDYVQANPSPIAHASADVTDGPDAELTVNFSSTGTRHPAGEPLTLTWDFGDGSPVSNEANPTHVYEGSGKYTAMLTAADEDGREGVSSVDIVVGNARPTVSIVFPENGGFFDWGDEVSYKVVIDDPDGAGEIDCSQVQVLPALGHDSHQHPAGELSGCEGSFPTGRDGGHGITSNIFWVVDVRYTDDGGQAGVPLTGYGTNLLTAKHQEAEFFAATGSLGTSGGVQTEATGDAGGGLNLSYVEAGDWWSYEPVNFKGIDGLRARLAAPPERTDSRISLRWNSPEGEEIGSIDYTTTGDWQTYEFFDAELGDLPTETGTLYFVLESGGVNVNYYEWSGDGVDSNSPPVIDLAADITSGPAPLTVNATASATDPEGGEVTLQWKQGTGDEFVAGGDSQQYTYTESGTYQLTVRATDEDGGSSEETVQIKVAALGAELCLAGRSDDFDGANLDNARWNRIVRPSQDARIEDGALVVPATRNDIYSTNNTPVPNIILQDLPDGAWQATTKVTIAARENYQQAGLIVYGDDDNYAKVVIQGRGGNAADRIIQFIREENADPNEVAASNSAGLGADFPDTAYLRFTSDGSNLKASYSADGTTFIEMTETKSLAGIADPRIGLVSLAGVDSAGPIVEAHFDWFHITPDDTAVVGPDDEFDGASLNSCRWSVENPNLEALRVSNGSLQIDTEPTDIYGGDSGVHNFVVQDQPDGDWVIETKVDATQLDRSYQQGGLIVRVDDDNYVKLDVLATNSAGSAVRRDVEIRSEIGGVVQNPQPTTAAPASGIVWLRLAREGDVFTGSYSADGEQWTALSESVSNNVVDAGSVGLYALGNSAQGNVNGTASFDFFRVVESGEQLTVSHELDPSSADGANDWYTGPVSVTISTTGGGESTVYREVRIDGGDWNEYTTPVTVSTDGEHTVEYRASTPDADPVAGSVEFRIDATVPTSTAAVEAVGGDSVLTIEGEDATSGVALVEYRVDGGDWTEYTEPVTLDAAAASVTHRATDEAGNQSAESVLEVAAAPAVDLTTTIQQRCMAGKVYLIVQTRNGESVPVKTTIETAYGDKTLPAVKAGATVSSSFATRVVDLEDGSVSVTAEAVIDGETVTSVAEVAYTGSACG